MGQAVPSTSIVAPSRRALLTGAVALTSAAAFSVKAGTQRPADWQAFIDEIAFLHPNGRRAAELAYHLRDKVKLADHSGIILTGRGHKDGYPLLMFGDWTRRGAITVMQIEAWEGGHVQRGTGPWLVKPRNAGEA